jgi:hypothetical protein
MNETFFGHLVYRFSSSPENLATKALNFIFNRSHVARESFTNLMEHLNIPLPPDMKYETQNSSSEDDSIPDLVGKDSNGESVLLGEAKFWAGLTDHQPVTYLRRLSRSKGKALVFFAPARRFSTLWPELLRRCPEADLQIELVSSEISDVKIAKLQQNLSLVLMSWRVLLSSLRQSLEAEGEREMLANLFQLQGLCDQMDESAFLPLQSEELTSNTSLRLIQFCDIVDEVTETLVSQNRVSIKGLRATATRSTYLRYMILPENGCTFEFNPNLWQKYRLTPLWFGIKSSKTSPWKYDPEAKKKLVRLEMEEPSRLIREGDTLFVPIYLATGMEKPEVVKNILDQINEILLLLISDTQIMD